MLRGPRVRAADVDRLLAGARLGASGVLVITGEPGIGKTALLDEAVATWRGMRVLRARGTEAEHEVPFARPARAAPSGDSATSTAIPAPQARALAVGAGVARRRRRTASRSVPRRSARSPVCREAAPWCWSRRRPLLDRPRRGRSLFAARRLRRRPDRADRAARDREPGLLDGADLPEILLVSTSRRPAESLVACPLGAGGAPRTPDPAHARRRQPAGAARARGRPGAARAASAGRPAPRSSGALATAFLAGAGRLAAGRARRLLVVAADGRWRSGSIAAAAATLGVDVARARGGGAGRRWWPSSAVGSGSAIRWCGRRSTRAPTGRAPRRARRLAGALPVADVDHRAWHLAAPLLGPDAASPPRSRTAGAAPGRAAPHRGRRRAGAGRAASPGRERASASGWPPPAEAAWYGGLTGLAPPACSTRCCALGARRTASAEAHRAPRRHRRAMRVASRRRAASCVAAADGRARRPRSGGR